MTLLVKPLRIPAGSVSHKSQKMNYQGLFDGEELLALARLDIQKGSVDAALAKLKQALLDSAAPIEAALETARVYAQLGLRHKAKPLYERYLSERSGDWDAKFQLGMLCFESGESLEAMRLWDEVLASVPVHPPALFYKGLWLAESRRGEEAASVLESLLRQVDSENLYFGRTQTLLRSIKEGTVGERPAARLQ